MNIDNQINAFFEPVSQTLAGIIFYAVPVGPGADLKIILAWLVLAALFFTLYLGFANIRLFIHAWKLVFSKEDSEGTDGTISRFQALATALSGTVGLGNIAGVAVAVSLGGPGAVLWMVVMAFFSMSTKFAEVMLGVKYRHHPDKSRPESIAGGPMYYLRDGFDNRNIKYIGHILGGLFAAFCMIGALGAGATFQANQAFVQAVNITGGEASVLNGRGWLFGLGMLVMVGLVIIGGIRSIAKVTSRIVPFMGGLYVLTGLFVIALHYTAIPDAFAVIFEDAFSLEAGLGGFLGGLLMGVQRAAFSNEAGLGSAAIAHSAVKTAKPVSQGLVGMLGPFIDTIVICTITALVIVVSGAYEQSDGIEGVALTSRAFESGFAEAQYILFAVVFLFAYSTMISWSYYGSKTFAYLFGTNKITENIYKVIFLAFIVIGASSDLSQVILFTDSVVFAMAIPNIIGLYLLAPEIRRDLKAYVQDLKAGVR